MVFLLSSCDDLMIRFFLAETVRHVFSANFYTDDVRKIFIYPDDYLPIAGTNCDSTLLHRVFIVEVRCLTVSVLRRQVESLDRENLGVS